MLGPSMVGCTHAAWVADGSFMFGKRGAAIAAMVTCLLVAQALLLATFSSYAP